MPGGLILRLRPHEKVLINGVVLENGDRRTRFRVRTPSANILRIRDALHPDEADTPVKRLYYVAQLGLTGETDIETVKKDLERGLTALRQAFGDKVFADEMEAAERAAADEDFFKVMRLMRKLIPHEAALLKKAGPVEADRV